MSKAGTLRRVVLIMPCLNSASYLQRSIDAFLAQDSSEKRLVIVDGGSNDGSHEIIAERVRQFSEIVWLRERDSGISNALNIAMAEVTDADIWGYLGADDLLLPGILRQVQQLFSCVPNIHGTYFDSYTLKAGCAPALRRCPDLPFTLDSLVRYGTLAGLQNIYLDGGIVRRYRFNESARYSMDYELYLRLTRDGLVNIFYVPQPSTINIADGNISSRFAIDSNLEALGYAKDIAGWNSILVRRYVRHFMSMIIRRFLWISRGFRSK